MAYSFQTFSVGQVLTAAQMNQVEVNIRDKTSYTTAIIMSAAAINEAATVIVASATSTAIGAAASNNVDISGTTSITSFDTVAEGINRKGRFTGALTLTHNATSLILPGAANITTAANDRYEARSLGSGNWIVTKYEKADGTAVVGTSVGNHEAVVHTANGHATTNNKIRRFSTVMTNVGTAITYADSAADGASFTINVTGFYSIQYTDGGPTGARWGISRNSAELTTGIESIAIATRLSFARTAASENSPACRTLLLTAADVIRPHTDGFPDGASNITFFSIAKVGNT